MLEILVCKDENITKELYNVAGVTLPQAPLAIRAMNGDKLIGFSLFEIAENKQTVLYLSPENDVFLADGLLRSALHVGTERSITDAFYGEKISEELLNKINFLENAEEKRLRLQNLFTDCCNCAK